MQHHRLYLLDFNQHFNISASEGSDVRHSEFTCWKTNLSHIRTQLTNLCHKHLAK